MKKTLILMLMVGGIFSYQLKGQIILNALEGEEPNTFTPSEKCLELVKDKHYGDGIHNFVYCAVMGPGNKKWLNLNLGAEYAREPTPGNPNPHFNPAATSTDYNDWRAFGALYQFGRDSDGHELVEYSKNDDGYWYVQHKNGRHYNPPTPGRTNQFYIGQFSSTSYWNDTNDPCPTGYQVVSAEWWVRGVGTSFRLNGPMSGPRYLTSKRFPNLTVVLGPNMTYNGNNPRVPWKTTTRHDGAAGVGRSILWLSGRSERILPLLLDLSTGDVIALNVYNQNNISQGAFIYNAGAFAQRYSSPNQPLQGLIHRRRSANLLYLGSSLPWSDTHTPPMTAPVRCMER